MKRRLFNLAAALSLLLCAATTVLWVRSYWRFDLVQRSCIHHEMGVSLTSAASAYGGLLLQRSDSRGPGLAHAKIPPDGVRWHFNSGTSAPSDPPTSSLAFGLSRDEHVSALDRPQHSIHSSTFNLRVPHWFLSILLAGLPLRWAALHRRARRQASIGRCPRCGYDLRASPDRCPECGAMPEQAKAVLT